MQKKVLITGVTGFLGSNIAYYLVDKGYNVIGLKRSDSCTSRIQKIIDKISLFDLGNIPIGEIFHNEKGISVIIHTATDYGRKNNDFFHINNSNINFPLEVLVSGMQSGIKTFINSDTTLERFVNQYAMTKYQFREWGKFLCQENEFGFVNLRLEHFYGPGDDPSKFTTHVIQSCSSQTKELLLTKGDQLRDFVYIDDVVSGFGSILNNIDLFCNGFYQFDLGSGKAISIREFAILVKRLTASNTTLRFGSIPYRSNEPMFSEADTSKMEKLGWSRKFSLEDGLKLTIDRGLF